MNLEAFWSWSRTVNGQFAFSGELGSHALPCLQTLPAAVRLHRANVCGGFFLLRRIFAHVRNNKEAGS